MNKISEADNINSKSIILLLILIILITLMIQTWLWDHITDDAYITYRYVERISNGDGFTFNPGERVEGFSNPLWILILSAFKLITPFELIDIARVLGVLSSCATITLMWITIKHLSPKDKENIFIIAAFMLLASPGFHIYASAGLEGPLLSLLILAGIYYTLCADLKRQYIAALCFGLAGIVRPEGPLYGIIWFILVMRIENIKYLTFKKQLLRFLIFISPVAAYQLFRILYFGALLPNTAIAKQSGTYGTLFGLPYLFPWMMALGGPVVAFLFIFYLIKGNIKHNKFFFSAMGPIISAIIFIIYAQGDWMPFGRFMLPVWPLILICFSVWLNSFLDDINIIKTFNKKHLISFLLLIALVLSSLFAWGNQIVSYVLNEELNMLMRGNDQVIVGEWLADNIEPGSSVATIRLGGISYMAPELIFWDLLGLTDKQQALFISEGSPGGTVNSPVVRRKPDIIAAVKAPTTWCYTEDDEFLLYLNKNYNFIKSFPQGNFGAFDIWIYNESMQVLSDNYMD